MAKSKYKFNKLYNIKLHSNRWLIWAIAYALIVAVAVIGYIQVSEINFETGQIAENQFQPWHSYTDHSLGFSLRYPTDWSIEATNSSNVTFIPANSTDAGVTVQVAKSSAQKAFQKSLKILSQTKTALDGQPAIKIMNDLGKGHSETVILAVYKTKLYIMRGTDSLVAKLMLTFNFLK